MEAVPRWLGREAVLVLAGLLDGIVEESGNVTQMVSLQTTGGGFELLNSRQIDPRLGFLPPGWIFRQILTDDQLGLGSVDVKVELFDDADERLSEREGEDISRLLREHESRMTYLRIRPVVSCPRATPDGEEIVAVVGTWVWVSVPFPVILADDGQVLAIL